MERMGRLLIIIGLVCVVAGLVIREGGRLPGDVVIRRSNFTFYFPIATSLLLGLLLTVAMWLFRRR